MRNHAVSCLALLAAFFLAPAEANAASFTPLGDLPGGGFMSTANRISADGSTVVGSSSSASGYEAFVWDATHGMQGLGALPGVDFRSGATGVSADGSRVVGWSHVYEFGNRAFVWDATRGIQDLGGLPVGTGLSEAYAVSADGSTAVGWAGPGSGGGAFVWDTNLGAQGQDLGDLPGGFTFSTASGISADGSSVVGWSTSASGDEAFVWDATHGMQGLGDLPGGDFFSEAFDVSADGSRVVGWSSSASGDEAFLWDTTHGMQELDVFLSALGIDLTGWQLRKATSISADGLTIVGEGTNPNGETEAWIAVIPEPGTALLLGLGLVALAGNRKACAARFESTAPQRARRPQAARATSPAARPTAVAGSGQA